MSGDDDAVTNRVFRRRLGLFSRIFLAAAFLLLLLPSCVTTLSGAAAPTETAVLVDLPQLTVEPDPPTHTPDPAPTLPALVTAEPEAQATAVTPTAVFVPSATSSVPTATPTATATPTPTPTREASRGGVRVVRDALPSSVFCPMRETHLRDEALEIGRSAVCDLPLAGYRVGQGDRALVLVGGIHGGYEWNTILLAENTLNHLRENPEIVPPALSVYVIPNANPDGLYRVVGRDAAFSPPETFEETIPGRLNGNGVDLNRNWDCNWQAEAFWGSEPVSGGSAPFSEPETQALSSFLLELSPAAVLFWHSAAVGVYAAGCDQPHAASAEIAQIYGSAAGYEVYDTFDNYEVTGEASDWLALQGIPAITVELSTHAALDWEENLAGLEALLAHLVAEESESQQLSD